MKNKQKLGLAAAALGLALLCAALPAAAAAPGSAAAPAAEQPLGEGDLGQTNFLPSIRDIVSWFSGGEDGVAVTGINLGSYEQVMQVGSAQRVSPSLIPENASAAEVRAFSENEAVAVFDDNGYIRAVGVGTTRLGITAGNVTSYYEITVVAGAGTVTDFDLTIEQSSLHVGDQTSLGLAISPSTASVTQDDFTFTSSNTNVATVNAFGRVTAVGAGSATISATCSGITRSVRVTVTVATTGISVDNGTLILRPGASQQITARVTPSSAPQSLTYSSLDRSVATVSGSGVVTAVGTGSTSIVVSNGASKAAVTVIVNNSANASSEAPEATPTPSAPVEPVDSTEALVQRIEGGEAGQELYVAAADLPQVTAPVLRALYNTNSTLYIVQDGMYTMAVSGSKIRNASNTLSTALQLEQTDEGLSFTLNGGSGLPGEVSIDLDDGYSSYRYVHLHNVATGQYDYLDVYRDGVIQLDTAGQYLITAQRMGTAGLSLWFVAGAVLLLCALVVAYIFYKKRYWFW